MDGWLIIQKGVKKHMDENELRIIREFIIEKILLVRLICDPSNDLIDCINLFVSSSLI